MQFNQLLNSIQQINSSIKESAVKAINMHLTIHNWLIGFYIVEFEQNGEERAKYGENLLENLAESLNEKGLSRTNLALFKQFYTIYPQILQVLSAKSDILPIENFQTLSGQLQNSENQNLRTVSGQSLKNIQTLSAQSENKRQVPPEKLISKLSFSHLTLLLPIKDNLVRTFYEVECMKGSWSVRELKRQIESMYFERSGLSKDKETLSKLINENNLPSKPVDIIKDIYTFEFLGLPNKHITQESDLEQALLDSFSEFVLELGVGFCLEARQKRILIGDEYYFIDLVFYHKILKCNVLIELKTKAFKHHNAAQLNTYLNYFKQNEVLKGDNPPVGILLVADKNNALVEYAIAGMDENLFIQKYLVQLPSKKELEDYLNKQLSSF